LATLDTVAYHPLIDIESPALNILTYFFAYDKQEYARLVPLYLAEMTALRSTDPICLCGADEEVCSNITQALFRIEKDKEGDPSI